MKGMLGSLAGRRLPMVLLSLIWVSFGAALAQAEVPGTDGTINACYHKNSGNLRVVDAEAGQSCRNPENVLTWSDGQTGKVADSDLLDGIDSTQLILHCPAGYTRSRDVCFGARVSGNFYDAWFACLNGGGRLPDSAELAQIFPALVVGGGVPAEEDWTTDMTTAGTAISVSVSGFTVGWTDRPMTDAVGYRCILSPSNEGTPSPRPARKAGKIKNQPFVFVK